MKTLQTINHKKNEIQEVEFFKDAECTEDFDFTNAKNLYIELVGSDCTPIFALSNKLSGLGIKARIFTPIWHLGWRDGISPQTPLVTLADVLDGEDLSNVNLSKYTPEDNAVLFLTTEDKVRYAKSLLTKEHSSYMVALFDNFILCSYDKQFPKNYKNATIFLPHGTESELQRAEEVANNLWKNFGIKPNLCVLHWFGSKYEVNAFEIEYLCEDFGVLSNINKIITTNSTGVLKPEDSTERLQVIDCKKIFEEYLNESNLI